MLFRKPLAPTISLALQGGGAHGAFTWGVLDRLLEDGRFRFEGVSGTSAGAMNAVALAHGWALGEHDGARAALADFWHTVASSSPFKTAFVEGDNVHLSPALRMLMRWTHNFSPEQLNPYDINPLREILSAQIDFERLRREPGMKLFIAATHVRSGQLRLFTRPELTADMVLASACLPSLHRTVEVAGEPYWDGGFSANPAIFPLLDECLGNDVLMVLLAPLQRRSIPSLADEIRNRISDLTFTAAFLREMHDYARIRAQHRRSWLPGGQQERRVAQARFHVIQSPDLMDNLGTESKLAAHQAFFDLLRDEGREAADQWLQTHALQLGRASTVDLGTLFAPA